MEHDVEELTLEDFRDESQDTAQYVILQVQLNQAASRIYLVYFSPSGLNQSHDVQWRDSASLDIQETFRQWQAGASSWRLWNDSHHLSLLLKVCYHHYIINLQQRLASLCPITLRDFDGWSIMKASSNEISRLVEDSLLYWKPEYFPMIYISAMLSALTVSRTSSPASTATLSETRSCLLALKQFEQVYVLARWVRMLFMGIQSHQPLGHSEKSEGQSHSQSASFRDPADGCRSNRSAVFYGQNSYTQLSSNLVPPGVEPTSSEAVAKTSEVATSYSAEPTMIGACTSGEDIMPNYCHNDPFLGWYDNEVESPDYPPPGTLEYKTLYFLEDLGITEEQWSQNSGI